MSLFELLIWQDRDTDEPDQVMKIPLPGTLKKQLVDDWEFVTQLGQVNNLVLVPCLCLVIIMSVCNGKG